MAIQMPPLYTALVEVHLELAKCTRTTKNMAQKENGTLSARLRHAETQLQAPQQHRPTEGVLGDFQLPDKELYDQLRAKAREVDTLTQPEESVEGNFKMLHRHKHKARPLITDTLQEN